MGINSSYNKSESQLLITIEGRFDFSCHQSFRETYESLSEVPKSIVIDLHETTYLDSSALGMLLLLRDYAGGESANIQLQHVSSDVKKILAISNFNQLFIIN